MTERAATFATNSWAGYSETPCVVVGETPKRYRVKLTQRCRLPGRMKWGYAGEIVLMPKRSITFAADGESARDDKGGA